MFLREGIFLKINFAILLATLFFLPTILLVAGESHQINSFIGSEPTIDGIIDSTERNASGKPTEILLPFNTWYMGGGDHLPRKIEVGSIHTYNSNLYINTKIEYEGIKAGNITYYLRKNGTEDYFDLKEITSRTNNVRDGYRIPYDWPFYDDTESGGTLDAEGKSSLTENSLSFELLIPYNSNDTIGHDINVTINDEIEIKIILMIMYLNDSREEWNYYTWPSENSWVIAFQDTTASASSCTGLVMMIVIFSAIIITRMKSRMENK